MQSTGTNQLTGTILELRQARARWQRLADAVAELANGGYGGGISSDVTGDIAAMGEMEFVVPLPCLLCKQPAPVATRIGDPAGLVPTPRICGRCIVRVDAASPLEPVIADFSQSDAIRHAMEEVRQQYPGQPIVVRDVLEYLAAHGWPGVAQQRVYDVIRRDRASRARLAAGEEAAG